MRNVPANAQALLDLDKDGALVPHGIGGHARTIITEFISEHGRLTARIAALKPFVDEFKACRDSYIRRYPRHPAVGADNFDKMPDDWPMETSDFSMGVFRFARTTLEASERGGGE